jgi:hypothetical protein
MAFRIDPTFCILFAYECADLDQGRDGRIDIATRRALARVTLFIRSQRVKAYIYEAIRSIHSSSELENECPTSGV